MTYMVRNLMYVRYTCWAPLHLSHTKVEELRCMFCNGLNSITKTATTGRQPEG